MIYRKLFIFGITVLTFFAVFKSVSAAETRLYIPGLQVQRGQSFEVPVKVDHVEKLAGIKLMFHYDPQLLIYEKLEKSKETSSLMHVLNDKEPGKLILVMAGAKGISGKDIELFRLYFKAVPGVNEKIVTTIKIVEIELVSDELKEIPCKLSESKITVLP